MLSEPMRAAVIAASAAYAALGVRYALVGGLAAGVHGEPRFTKDIDFLVGDEAFVRSGMIVSFAKPMPLQAGDVAIDPIPLPDDPRRKAILDAALSRVMHDESAGVSVPVLDATALSFMKLASPRAKDLSDVVAMLRSGAADLAQLTRDTEGDPALRTRLDAAVAELRADDDAT
jgi:hypothetical protein